MQIRCLELSYMKIPTIFLFLINIYSYNILLLHCIFKNSPLFHMFHKNIQKMTSPNKLNAIDAIVMKDI